MGSTEFLVRFVDSLRTHIVTVCVVWKLYRMRRHDSLQPTSATHVNSNDCGKQDNVKIVYFNARSILPKLDELRLICYDHVPHIVRIVETWLDDTVTIVNCQFLTTRLFG